MDFRRWDRGQRVCGGAAARDQDVDVQTLHVGERVVIDSIGEEVQWRVRKANIRLFECFFTKASYH